MALDDDPTVIGERSGWEEIPPASLIDNYRIIKTLGRGGMGTVYLAEQITLEKKYALKVLPSFLGYDPPFKARFLQEGRNMARLEHPGIVPVHYAGSCNDLNYIAMDYLPGGNLESYLKACRDRSSHYSGDATVEDDSSSSRNFPAVSPAEVKEILRQVLEALVFAHASGVVHCDLKPANLLLQKQINPPHGSGIRLSQSDLTIKIADFGLAQVIGEGFMQSFVSESLAASATNLAGAMVAPRRPGSSAGFAGTVHFIAPEVLDGDSASVLSDLYSVGIIGYYLLTGVKPVGRYVSASSRVAGLGRNWDDFLNLLMESDPSARTQSASFALKQLAALDFKGSSRFLPSHSQLVKPSVAENDPNPASVVSQQTPDDSRVPTSPPIRRSPLQLKKDSQPQEAVPAQHSDKSLFEEVEYASTAIPTDVASTSKIKYRLKARSADLTENGNNETTPASKRNVKGILREAYFPQHRRDSSARLKRRLTILLWFALLWVGLVTSSLVYVNFIQSAPFLSPLSDYTVFLLMLVPASFFIGLGVWHLLTTRFYSKVLVYLAAGILIFSVNTRVLQIISDQDNASLLAVNNVWSLLLTYELLKTTRPDMPRSMNTWFNERYIFNEIQRMPESSKILLFERYLNDLEMRALPSTGYFHFTSTVTRRILNDSTSPWHKASRLYSADSSRIFVIRQVIRPYLHFLK